MPSPPRINIDSQRIQRAINALAPYFQITTPRSVYEAIALQEITGLRNTVPNSSFRPARNVALLVDTLLNTTEGGLPVLPGSVEAAQSILEKLHEYSTPTGASSTDATDEELRKFATLFKVYHGGREWGTQTPDKKFSFSEM